VAFRLSTKGMAVDVFVGAIVGGTEVRVWVGGAGVGVDVSMAAVMGGTTTVAAGASTGAVEGRVQAVSRKIRAMDVLKKFCIAVYL
jgi:predicted amidohydrolase